MKELIFAKNANILILKYKNINLVVPKKSFYDIKIFTLFWQTFSFVLS